MHFDSVLSRVVVEDLLEEPRRAVAASPGIDLGAVCRHALAARRRHAIRDAFLAVLLIGCGGYALYGLAGPMFGADGPGLFLATYLAILVLAPLGWVVNFVEGYVTRWGPNARSLRLRAFEDGQPPEPASELRRGQLAHVDRFADGNVTVYRGYNPFVGQGWSVRAWSFALDLTIAKQTGEPVVPFAVTELYDFLEKRITDLDIGSLRVSRRLFVNGADVHSDTRFVPDPHGAPVGEVGADLIGELIECPEDHARPYLAAQIIGWDGELAWSAFLRARISDSSLFVEVNYCVLPPLWEMYQEIDDLLLSPTMPQVSKLARHSLRRLPRTLRGCIPNSLNGLLAEQAFRRKMDRQEKEMREKFTFDHGTEISIREAASELRRVKGGLALGYHRHFQLLDEQMWTKTVEKRIIDALAEFLTDHNIDSRELQSRAEQVSNTHVHIGGDATLMNSAIGGVSATVSLAAGAPSRRASKKND